MERIGVRELRQNASRWLKRANAGERIEVTSRGQVVAVLVPPPRGSAVDDLRRSGRLVPASHEGALPRPERAPRSASAELAALRSEER